MYDRDDNPFVPYARAVAGRNRETLSAALSIRAAEIEQLMNVQHELATAVMWVLERPGAFYVDDSRQVAFAGFHKSLLLLFSSYELTMNGLYGTARTLFRSIYEWLLIAKYCSSGGSPSVLQKWQAGDEIWVSAMILKKISSPNPDPLKRFWRELCQFAHATTFSGQVDVELTHATVSAGDAESEVRGSVAECRTNLALLQILVRCNYHLLNSHVIPGEVAYKVTRYAPFRNDGRPDLRAVRREGLKMTRSAVGLSAESRMLLSAYRKKWQLS
jgi:hypothetical protein